MANEIAPYNKVRGQLCTFTVINCVQNNWFWKRIGHTAILYKDPWTLQLMIFESTTLNKFSGKSGVQMMPFGVWLARYPGKVFARVPKFDDRTPLGHSIRREKASAFIRDHLGTSYPDLKTMTGRFKLYLSSLDFKLFGKDWFTYKGKDDGIFCTELVIKLLQHCGLCQSSVYAHEFEPDNTRNKDKWFQENLRTVTYLPEIRLK